MKTAFNELMSGLDDVDSYLSGEMEGFRVHVPKEINVKEIRSGLHMTQAKFSTAFGFSLDAVKHWEGGRRMPEVSARAYLTVIRENPGAVIKALAASSESPKIAYGKVKKVATLKSKKKAYTKVAAAKKVKAIVHHAHI